METNKGENNNAVISFREEVGEVFVAGLQALCDLGRLAVSLFVFAACSRVCTAPALLCL